MKFNRNVIDTEIVVVRVSVLDRVAGVTGVTGDISDEVDADAVFPHSGRCHKPRLGAIMRVYTLACIACKNRMVSSDPLAVAVL